MIVIFSYSTIAHYHHLSIKITTACSVETCTIDKTFTQFGEIFRTWLSSSDYVRGLYYAHIIEYPGLITSTAAHNNIYVSQRPALYAQ